jgi:hypothetical protein
MTESHGYKTDEAFRMALEERLSQIARREDVDLQRLRRRVAFDRLLARLALAADSPWVLKGGYAMELRFRKARSTKDLDFTLRMAPAGNQESDPILDSLQGAAAADLGDFFVYRVGNATSDLEGAPYGGARYPVISILAGRTFAQFHVDIGVGDPVLDSPETIRCRDWLEFAGIPAAAVPVISAEQQFAEKVHAYTLPRRASPNSRVRDFVDMLLLTDGSLSKEKTKEAIERTFERRATHPMPETLRAPDKDWEKPFASMAAECGIDSEIGNGFATINRFWRSLRTSKR